MFHRNRRIAYKMNIAIILRVAGVLSIGGEEVRKKMSY